jgi:DeoR family transcriptional regulator, suf operon transcriptional repressor
MLTTMLQTDRDLVDVLRRRGRVSVQCLVEELEVTATAVRQRLHRLMADGLVERKLVREGRGRPAHHYGLTQKGEATGGTNYTDLVAVLWEEIRSIEEPTIRAGLLKRLASRLAEKSGELAGDDLSERMQHLAGMMNDREVPFEVDYSSGLPVLTALACPYPDLAARDRTICSVEKMLFSEMLGERVRLTDCRLEGATCCSFTPSETATDRTKN